MQIPYTPSYWPLLSPTEYKQIYTLDLLKKFIPCPYKMSRCVASIAIELFEISFDFSTVILILFAFRFYDFEPLETNSDINSVIKTQKTLFSFWSKFLMTSEDKH